MLIAGLDVETTGIADPKHRIIELHVQKWDAADFDHPRLLGDKTWRIHPDRSIEAKAFAVHHISLDDLAGCPKFEAVVDEIMAHLAGVDLFVAHNADFDRQMMRYEVQRVKPTYLPALDALNWFDTMEEGRWATPWGKVPNLRELCWACDVNYDPSLAHAAAYDVTVMMKSFFFGVRAGFFKPALTPVMKVAA